MNKEITPKEAQEALNQLNNFISREKHIDSERNKTINKCVDTLIQALDHLEQLEIADRNNQNLVKTNVDLVNKNLELQKENQELLMAIENKNNEIKNLKKLIHDKPYKKVITWLKNTFEIILDSKVRISDGTDCIQAFPIDLKTNEVLYDLIKEVLG